MLWTKPLHGSSCHCSHCYMPITNSGVEDKEGWLCPLAKALCWPGSPRTFLLETNVRLKNFHKAHHPAVQHQALPLVASGSSLSQITAEGDCSHKIKRHLLLERKVMTNLDSRDITFPTKVCLVKAMVFPVVMYGYDSSTIKKAEC